MWIRKQIDIRWPDLIAAWASCLTCFESRCDTQQRICGCINDAGATVFLSVRSGFDCLLGCVDWPQDAEVLFSSVTIGDMPRIAIEHGFVPVGVPLDPHTLAPSLADLRSRVTPRTRAIVMAHLFGNRVALESIAQFARDHNLMLIEDCAQNFAGRDYRGSELADVSMFSFGPIKTSTALGGAVFRIRSAALRAAIREQQGLLPVQSRWRFSKRVLKYSLLKLLSSRGSVAAIFFVSRLLRIDFDLSVSKLARGFSGPSFFRRIRQRPCVPLLSVLERRLRTFDSDQQQRRMERGRFLASWLEPRIDVLNRPACPAGETESTYWVFAVRVANPAEVVAELVQHGFDATRQSSLVNVGEKESDWVAEPPSILEHIVFLPFHDRIPAAELRRMARVILEVAVPCAIGKGAGASARLTNVTAR